MLVAALLAPTNVAACSVLRLDSPEQLVDKSDAIYRARAEAAAEPLPADPARYSSLPDSRIRFRIVGVLKGSSRSSAVFQGTFARSADPNDHAVPYQFVRPGGRSGNCFATSYLKGQEYLLFVRANSIYWSPLAPTAEEISGPTDPWVAWVRKYLQRTLPSAPRG